MADKTISQLNVVDTIYDSDYIVIDNTEVTMRSKVGNLSGIYVTNAEYNILDNLVTSLSGSWQSAASGVSNLATVSSEWDSVFTTTNTNSGNWQDTYTLNTANSAKWLNAYILTDAYYVNWNSAYSSARATSANWDSVYSSVVDTSGNWDSVYSSVVDTSGNWDSVYSSVVDTSANWDSSYASTVAASGNWDSVYSSVVGTSANWNSVYSSAVATSAKWDSVYSSAVATSANWDSVYSSVVDTSANWDSVYSSAVATSANWDSVYSSAVATSANWDSVYSSVSSLSSTWDLATVLNHISTNSVTISSAIITDGLQVNKNVLIFGNISATGTANFADTIFSTTTALSVVHTGAGPAMWVGSNGADAIASFYDIDQGVEMLHVGGVNNFEGYGVGIKTSTPNKALTVNGEISANNVIYDASGNSTNWNSVYSSVVGTSANWNSVYSSVVDTSANWDSVYTSVSALSTSWDEVTTNTGTNLSGFIYGNGTNIAGAVEAVFDDLSSYYYPAEKLVGYGSDGQIRVPEYITFGVTGRSGNLSFPAEYFSQQLGQDIEGDAAGDFSGFSVSMNAAGDRIAIGATGSDQNGFESGQVRIYSWNGTDWEQLGSDIYGEAAYDRGGHSVSMNAAGDRVAIGFIGMGYVENRNGYTRIYSWSGAVWTQLGVDIEGEAGDDRSGTSVSMNAAGDRVAIGAIYNDGNGSNSGHVRIYSWNGSAWTQLGVDIDGEAAGDFSGYSVSMNAAGNRVAIGAIANDGNGTSSGHTRIYSWNGSAWTQLGLDIDGEAAEDLSGYSVSMNAAGNRVAIGAIFNNGNSLNTGHARIYSWNGTDWEQLGSDIDGETSSFSTVNGSGFSISMNAAGDRVAIGAIYNDGNGSNSGHVRIYSWNGSAWTQLGVDIDGEAAGDFSGYSVSMNAAGNRVAIGAIANDGNGTSSGHVRIYGFDQSYQWTLPKVSGTISTAEQTLPTVTNYLSTNNIILSSITVGGSISSGNVIYDVSGNSVNWNSVYSSVVGASANWDSVYSSAVATSANWDSAYTSVSALSASWSQGNSAVNAAVESTSASWNKTYTVVGSNSAAWSNNILYARYGIPYNNIQIKGAISQNSLLVYTALVVEEVPLGLAVGITVQDDNNKLGTLRYIDRINKILYIEEVDYNTNFIIGDYTTNNNNSFTVIEVDSFSSTLQTNHTLKIFNATDNILSAASLPDDSVSVLPVNPTGTPTTVYDYKIAQFKYSDGKFSSTSTSTDVTSCYNVAPALLNDTNFNRLVLKRSSNDYGLAIYRKTSNEEELGYRLITILGEGELGASTSSISYLDRGGLNANIWASDIKDDITGSYVDNSTFYIPTNIDDLASDRYSTGFTTVRLTSFSARQEVVMNKSLTGCSTVADIFIDCSAMYNNTGELVGGFAKAIEDNSKGNISKIYIPSGNYYTSTLRLSSNCLLEGETKDGTNIILLPWEFYGQGAINASNITNFNIENITIDGNHANNLGRNNFEYNFLLNTKDSSKFVLENINVVNSTRGGIYALRSEDFKIINTSVKNGAIELTADTRGTALFAQQAVSFILNSNNFENWLGPINLSVSRIGSAANNVIKNCGAGIVVYGATSLQISPNLILGQDNEMLPVADLFDTKFDAVNIELEAGEEYISDIILYMRDGKGAWLSNLTLSSGTSSLPGTNVTLSTEIKTLVKTGNYSYTLPFSSFNYSTYANNVPTISIISTEDNLKQGRVQFKLNTAAIDSLSTYGELKLAYDALTGRPEGETLVSLVYKIKATEYLFLDRSNDDLITIDSYQFNTSNKLILNLDTKSNISLFSINDVIYGVNLTNGSTNIDQRELIVEDVVVETVGSNITTAYLVCSGNYNIQDPQNTLIDCINTGESPSYVGIKNSFTISKGTINKI